MRKAAQLLDATAFRSNRSGDAVPLGIEGQLLGTLDTRKQVQPKLVKYDASNPEITVTLTGRDGVLRRIDAWRWTDLGPMMRLDGAGLLYGITQLEYDELLRIAASK